MPGEERWPQLAAYIEERAPILYLRFSRSGRIVEANDYAEKITGRRLLGDNIQDLVVDFAGTFEPTALIEGGSDEHLFNISGASGLPHSFYFTFSQAGEHILALGRLDAAELDEMRVEIISLNQDLSNLMRALHKSNAQLKRLNEEKNRFLGMAAHDLRKPIGVVIAYSEFLVDEARDRLDGEQLGFLETISSSSLFMKRLVDDFLDVSVIEAGRFELNLQTASLGDALEYGLTLNRLQAGRKGVELQLRCERELPVLPMDKSKIEQAITNLVANAVEHSDPGSAVVITLTSDQLTTTFSVQDHGAGIPAADRDQLFKAFGVAATAKTGGEKSTGLGLLITRKIVEAHGGRIWLDSEPGEGTTVHFNLPLHGAQT